MSETSTLLNNEDLYERVHTISNVLRAFLFLCGLIISIVLIVGRWDQLNNSSLGAAFMTILFILQMIHIIYTSISNCPVCENKQDSSKPLVKYRFFKTWGLTIIMDLIKIVISSIMIYINTQYIFLVLFNMIPISPIMLIELCCFKKCQYTGTCDE